MTFSKRAWGFDCIFEVAVSGLLPFAPDAPGGPTTISLPEVQTLSEILRLKSEAISRLLDSNLPAW